MATEQGKSRSGAALRATVGVVLFVVWGVLTFLWVYDAVHASVPGEAGPASRAVIWLLLMLLLAGMEGLEIAVGLRWSHLYPDRPTSDLAGWLAARQLFVALIVTGATLLADRDSLAIPFVATPFTGAVALKIFNLVFTTLTVLWFMQIFPKHMAATNADRYLKVFRAALFPVVEFVRVIGVSWPAGSASYGLLGGGPLTPANSRAMACWRTRKYSCRTCGASIARRTSGVSTVSRIWAASSAFPSYQSNSISSA